MDNQNALPPDQKQEGAGTLRDYYTIDADDTSLVNMINQQLKTASNVHEKFKKEGKINESYWGRDHFKYLTTPLRWHMSRIIQNVVYMGVETMVPIITSKPAEPIITIAGEEEDSDEAKTFTDALQEVLLAKYYDIDYPQQELMEMLARHLLLYKVGIPKIIWEESIDDFYLEWIHPHKVVISPDGHYPQDVWVAQYLEKPFKDLLDMFPDKEDDISSNIFPGLTREAAMKFGNTPIGFWEYQPDNGKYVVWKMRDVILQKKLNPYIKWTEDKKFDREANHFDYSHKTIMFLNSQKLGRYVWDDTTPVSQVLPIQDGINLMQRIITDTARDQGILIGAEEMIDRDELYKYTGAPNDKLSVKGADPTKALFRLPPKELQAFVQNNLQHLINMADNIMGTHATTRGERSGNTTATQDQLAKESDYGRIDQIVRGIERLFTSIYNWEVQMMLVKYEPKHFERYIGKEKGQKLYDQLHEYNKKGIKIIVKPGSTLPTDKNSQRAEALGLAKMNRISNLDLFKRMDFANPMELAKNIWLEANKPEELYKDLAPHIQEKKKRDETAQTLGAGAAPTGGAAVPEQVPAQVPAQQQPAAPQLQGGTEHTQALLQGQPVPPFEGIQPPDYQPHLDAEFTFISEDGFNQLPPEIQKLYAQHALAERDILQGGGQQ